MLQLIEDGDRVLGTLSLLPDMYYGNLAPVTIAQVTVVAFTRYAPLASDHPNRIGNWG